MKVYLFKRVENIVTKGDIACFQKMSAGEASESIFPTTYIQAMVLSNNLNFRVDNIFLIMINI